MKTQRFSRAHRAWEATWVDGPDEDPADRWVDELSEMSDSDLISAGRWSDADGLDCVKDDPYWIAEMKERGL